MNISVSVSGNIDAINGLAQKINSNLSNAILAGANTLAQNAQAMCPVDTGNLRDSISASSSGNGATVSVGADYGIYVEFGTYKTPAQPFLAPSIAASEAEILSAIIGGLNI